ncbi:hypothetical protein ADK58_25200 [Streptomyces sp. XY152]|nr:hypothetical protein ADK58_25200 [Streptomyces sp. XY152]
MGGDPVNHSDPTGLLSLDTLGNIGSGLSVAGIVHEGLTDGPDAAEAATAGVIADIGIAGLCTAGAAVTGGPAGAGALNLMGRCRVAWAIGHRRWWPPTHMGRPSVCIL